MLYNDLVRLNAIDEDIIRHLERLTALYEERASIMQIPTRTPTKKITRSIPKQYKELQESWAAVGVTVPKLDSLRRKLADAFDFIAKHEDTAGSPMEIVLIPPERSLLDAMQYIGAPAVDIQSYRDLRIKPNHAWRCAVVQSPSDRQHVEDVALFLQQHPADDEAFATLDTNAQLIASAYLQGVPLVETGTWNLILGDMISPQEVPCARLIGDRLRFSIDDSAGFLGMNYYYPSTIIGPKRRASKA